MAGMANRKSYLKEWRKHRGYTQDQVVGYLAALGDPLVPSTGASLSRLENGHQPYSQRVLEALADFYNTEPGYLLDRNPLKEGELIDLVAILTEKQKAQASAILNAMLQADIG